MIEKNQKEGRGCKVIHVTLFSSHGRQLEPRSGGGDPEQGPDSPGGMTRGWAQASLPPNPRKPPPTPQFPIPRPAVPGPSGSAPTVRWNSDAWAGGGLPGEHTFHGRVGVRAVGEHHVHILQLQPLQGGFQTWGEEAGGAVTIFTDILGSSPARACGSGSKT